MKKTFIYVNISILCFVEVNNVIVYRRLSKLMTMINGNFFIFVFMYSIKDKLQFNEEVVYESITGSSNRAKVLGKMRSANLNRYIKI